MNMARKKIPTNLALDPEILARIEVWMSGQEAPWTKTAFFEMALREALEKRDG